MILSKEIVLMAFVLSCAFFTVRLDSYLAFIEKPFDSHIVNTSTIEYLQRGEYFGKTYRRKNMLFKQRLF